ncbi:LysR family transcriptional regulator [Virgibacillus kekensis]|uniref:LysR family transcriptional regulator n=1 Tax=Virgibacillus kekensis TaxID=202261 RepID=A0ABV9DIH8_9BACI
MKIHQLKYFIAVAEELHFGRAARKLNVSQPPLSQQIKLLEHDLQATLFNRNKRNVELTPAGESLYENARLILHFIEHSKKEVLGIHKGEIGNLTVGFGGSIAFDILPEIIKTCSQSLPGIRIDLKQLTTNEQIRALEEKKIDVGILVTPIENQTINTKMLRKESLRLCLPIDHKLAIKEYIDPRELKEEKFILPPRGEGEGYFRAISQVFNDGDFTPNVVQTAKEQHTMVSLVSANIGIVIVPQSTTYIRLNNITYKEFTKPFYKMSSLAWNKNDRNPVIKSFLNLMESKILPKFS